MFSASFVPNFENLNYLVHLNDSMNDTLVDRNLDEEIVIDITGFNDEEVLDKHSKQVVTIQKAI